MLRVDYLLFFLVLGCDTANLEDQYLLLGPSDASPPIEKMVAVPSASQLRWQQGEMYMFIHFGMNTFTGEEKGDGTAPPTLFHPTEYNPSQWAQVAKQTGFDGVVFTAKHHEGFALWPTSTTSYSVASSDWKQGQGDVLGDIATAAAAEELRFGIYLSPMDRNEPSWGTLAYNAFYLSQIDEALSRQDDVFEFWLDGYDNNADVPPPYDYHQIYQTIYRHEPEAIIFGGAEIGWVGNESGIAGLTQWSVREPDQWFPSECDVANRPGWFWRESENDRVFRAKDLLQIYYTSVGRNCVLLLGVPPDTRGLIHENDVRELGMFRSMLDEIFGSNLIELGNASSASSRGEGPGWAAPNTIDDNPETFWVAGKRARRGTVSVLLDEAVTFNVIRLEEPIEYGQRVSRFSVQARNMDTNEWVRVASGTTIGYRRILHLPPFHTDQIKLIIEDAKGSPAISEIGLHFDPYSNLIPIQQAEEIRGELNF